MHPIRAARALRADVRAVREYERMLRVSRSDTLDAAQLTAFERLTTTQLDIVFEHFLAASPAARPSAARVLARRVAAAIQWVGTRIDLAGNIAEWGYWL